VGLGIVEVGYCCSGVLWGGVLLGALVTRLMAEGLLFVKKLLEYPLLLKYINLI
jgi:hypothetical protein